jgi:hypothetical protein
MNDLNSILLEGIVDDPKKIEGPGARTGEVRFLLTSTHLASINDAQYTETGVYIVSVEGKTAEACMEYLKAGRGVRIVGRVATIPQSYFTDVLSEIVYTHHYPIIRADHVEFKPGKMPKQEAEKA